MIGIYKITEKDNPAMFYVGKSNDIERRFNEHKIKTYEQTRIPFDGYIKEKGKDAFNYEILEECSLDQLDEREAYWITKLNAKTSGNKFDGGLRNVVGKNNPNAKLTEDDVQAIRFGAWCGITTRELGLMFDVAHQTISKVLTGRTFSWLK